MRKLASIQKIEWINPIEGKDRIELVGVLGWQVICKKGEYNIGDLTVFCEIDSILPEKEEFEFLRKNNFRIKTMKMGGVLSQGICFPLNILPKGNYIIDQDVTELMKIKQYEKTMDKETESNFNENKKFNHPFFTKFLFKFKIFRSLLLPKKKDKGFPNFIKRTDETRCLHRDTKIETNKGKLRISDIVNKKMNLLVKSYNENTNDIEYKHILSYQKYPHNESWIVLKYAINKYGNRMNTIKCTSDHKFYNGEKYILAKDLSVGDKIFNICNCWTDNTLNYLFGVLIGDSYVFIDKRPNKDGSNSTETRIQLCQGEKQFEYLKEKVRLFSGDTNKIYKAKSGYCDNNTYQYWFSTDYNLTNTLYDLGCIVNNRFVVNKNFCDMLNVASLAFWYLDDGTLRHRDGIGYSPTIQISTNSESIDEINCLISMLTDKFGIECNYRKERKYGSIYITTKGTYKFLKMISKYIPYSMRNKTINEFKNVEYVLNNIVFEKKDILLENEIKNISEQKQSIFSNTYSYDIEVDDNHNFFANRILTHNCQNAPFYLNLDCKYIATEKVDGQSGSFSLQRIKGKKDKFDYSVCSRNLRLWDKNDSSYWKVSDKYNIEKVLHDLIRDNEWVSIQGECLDTNVQGNKYKVKEADLYVFNLIYPNGRLNSIEAKDIIEKHGMKFVPIIDESISLYGKSVNEVLDYATGKSKLYDTLREGIVFRTLDGKQSFKAVSPDFLIKNNE